MTSIAYSVDAIVINRRYLVVSWAAPNSEEDRRDTRLSCDRLGTDPHNRKKRGRPWN
jgi:hypothetical protein